MESAAAAGLLTAITIFVFFGNPKPAVPPKKLEPRTYGFAELQAAVLEAVTPLGFSPAIILAGDIFVQPKPASGKPTRPDGDGLFEGDVNLAPEAGVSKIILLNLGNSLPAAAAAPAAGGGSGAFSAELLEAIRAIPAQVAAAVNPPDVESIMSDRDYERYARGLLFGKLVEHCGLEVARGTALDRRTLLGQQWDFRAPVRCAATRGDPRNVDGIFEAFLSEEGYIRPPNIPTRVITPTKAGGATEPISAEYLAVFEITSGPNWTRGQRPMLPRLEKRLRLSLERAKAKGYLAAEQTITDLIAVVGVASPHECSDSVCARMDVEVPEGELHPFVHLKAMMDVGRFVFIKVPKAGSPAASAAGGGGATGR